MRESDDQETVNLARWDEVAELHRVSYGTAGLVAQPDGMTNVAREDFRLLSPFLPNGSAAGLDVIHLQCHIGSDTLSWARLGAHMTGLDMSPESLRVARELAQQAGVEVEYVQSTISDAATVLAGRDFDVVYTSIGVLCWLDDLDVWARLIASLLRPNGLFFIREGHPIALSLDQASPAGVMQLNWPYFDIGPIIGDDDADYSSTEKVRNGKTYQWAHSLSEVIGALVRAGLTIVDFQEHQTLPWRLLPWMDEGPSTDSYVLPPQSRDLCPLTFSLVARR